MDQKSNSVGRWDSHPIGITHNPLVYLHTSIDGSHGLKKNIPLDLPVMTILLGISTIQRGMLGIYGIYMGHVFFSMYNPSRYHGIITTIVGNKWDYPSIILYIIP